MTLISRKDFAPNTFADLLAYVKANKDQVTYAHAGIGSASHLCGLLFLKAIETPITTVPYKGTGPAMNDLLGGQVDFMCDQTPNTLSHIKADKIKVYGVTSKEGRCPPGHADSQCGGLAGVRTEHLVRPVCPQRNTQAGDRQAGATLQEALKDDKLKARFAQFGAEPVSSDKAQPEALRAHVKAEIDKWGPIIKTLGSTRNKGHARRPWPRRARRQGHSTFTRSGPMIGELRRADDLGSKVSGRGYSDCRLR